MLRSPRSATALVQVLCGIVLAGVLVAQSAQTGAPVLLVGALIALVGFGAAAYRNYRRFLRESADPSGPAGGGPRGRGARRPRLSPDGDAALVHVIGVLSTAGLFAPRTPDPDHLTEAVADAGEPVTAGSVLDAFDDAAHHHPEFRPEDHRGALAGHAVRTERDVDDLREQVADLDRLTGDALDVRLDELEVTGERVVLRLHLGGSERVLEQGLTGKGLSTVVHVTVARALRAAGTGRRLAWVWTDQHVWIAALSGGVTVGGLNSDLDAPASERWEWVDEQEPVDAS